ncbi:repressor LexA [bacterium]|nr:repressor LexA [bacterium]
MLTDKQQKILDFISDFRRSYGQFPSIRQIGAQFAITARAVQQHIDALKRKGALEERQPVTAAYQLPGEFHYRIPLLGSIAAGQPLSAIERTDSYVEISPDYFGPNRNLFALEVRGESMTGDGIRDGDTAIIRQQTTVPNPETIVAVRVDADEFTLKRVSYLNDKVELRPSNPVFSPFQVAVDRVEIVGQMIGLVRKL